MDVPGLAHLLMVTDAAINIAPDLAAKVEIVQNAIDLAISLGIARPRVAVLSAVETVTQSIPSSIDAALLSKMAERGQITGGAVEGPLAIDNAVDLAAARHKGIGGAVAGRSAGGARYRRGQHAGQIADLPRPCRGGGGRAGGESADHPDLAGRQCDGAACLGCGGCDSLSSQVRRQVTMCRG